MSSSSTDMKLEGKTSNTKYLNIIKLSRKKDCQRVGIETITEMIMGQITGLLNWGIYKSDEFYYVVFSIVERMIVFFEEKQGEIGLSSIAEHIEEEIKVMMKKLYGFKDEENDNYSVFDILDLYQTSVFDLTDDDYFDGKQLNDKENKEQRTTNIDKSILKEWEDLNDDEKDVYETRAKIIRIKNTLTLDG